MSAARDDTNTDGNPARGIQHACVVRGLGCCNAKPDGQREVLPARAYAFRVSSPPTCMCAITWLGRHRDRVTRACIDAAAAGAAAQVNAPGREPQLRLQTWTWTTATTQTQSRHGLRFQASQKTPTSEHSPAASCARLCCPFVVLYFRQTDVESR